MNLIHIALVTILFFIYPPAAIALLVFGWLGRNIIRKVEHEMVQPARRRHA